MAFVLTDGICLGANLGQRHGSLERIECKYIYIYIICNIYIYLGN